MVFSPLKNYRRRRLLTEPFSADWLTHLRSNVALYGFLIEVEQEKLRKDLRVFIAEKNWEGCAGVAVTDEIKVTIAAHACLLLLGIEHDYFSRVLSILVYPTAFRNPRGHINRDGLIEENMSGRVGEAWYRGPVILAWDAVLDDAQEPTRGRNVVLHEFAHQLDFLDGLANGTPALKNQRQYDKWRGIMTAEFDKLNRDLERGRATLFDQYGATNPCEFFAVATEYFFTQPIQIQRRHPLVYKVLSEYYGQNPAARITDG